jgi:ubiquinone/menaquinone biosynthesis C-methylase UbiE
MNPKEAVREFWDQASCGEALYLRSRDQEGYRAQAKARYRLEGWMIFPFARFRESKGLSVLEIGVGLGADHQQFAQSGAMLTGIDLTDRAVDHTRCRLQSFGLHSDLSTADAENLPFPDECFDVVYSWGVLHHSPDTQKAIQEVFRVLNWGGVARIMIYHKWSVVGFMLWLRYGLMSMRPFRSLEDIYARHLESPGTKAYSRAEALKLFGNFTYVDVKTPLAHGDLLESSVGQRHGGLVLSIARFIWPRWFIRRFFPDNGLTMMITAYK